MTAGTSRSRPGCAPSTSSPATARCCCATACRRASTSTRCGPRLPSSPPACSPVFSAKYPRRMEYDQILADTRDGVLVLTLNRPERLNAWTPKMMAELTAEITAANDDPSIGAIVVTGAGRGFCAGADIGG